MLAHLKTERFNVQMYKHKKTHKPWSMSIWGGPDRRQQQEQKKTATIEQKENTNIKIILKIKR